MKRIRGTHVAIVVIAAVVAVGGVAGFRYVMSPSRHFLNYIHTYATQWRNSAMPGRPQQDQAWIQTHPTAVVTAGRSACTWLAAQPDAPPVDPTGKSNMSRMDIHYVDRVEGNDVPLARLTKWSVVLSAWNYLCTDQMKAKTAPMSRYDD